MAVAKLIWQFRSRVAEIYRRIPLTCSIQLNTPSLNRMLDSKSQVKGTSAIRDNTNWSVSQQINWPLARIDSRYALQRGEDPDYPYRGRAFQTTEFKRERLSVQHIHNTQWNSVPFCPPMRSQKVPRASSPTTERSICPIQITKTRNLRALPIIRPISFASPLVPAPFP